MKYLGIYSEIIDAVHDEEVFRAERGEKKDDNY